jgi:PST family polysaccharide transporter
MNIWRMGKLVRSASWTALSIFFRAGSNIALSKLIAMQFGPSGITLLAHFQNLTALYTSLPNDGINNGLVRYLAAEKGETERTRNILKAGLFLNLAVFLAVTFFLFLTPGIYFGPFFQGLDLREQLYWILLFLPGMLLLLLFLFVLTKKLAYQQLRWYVLAQTIAAAATIAFVAWASATQTLAVTLLAYLASLSFPVWFLLPRFWKALPLLKFSISPELKESLRLLGKFVLMALSVLICTKLVDFGVRSFMMQNYSVLQTGLWQGAVKLADSYTMVFLAVVGMVYYPRLSARMAEPATLGKFLKPAFWGLSGLVLLGLFLVYLLGDWLLLLLFRQEFVAARPLLPAQLAGDFFKLSSWLLAYLVMAQEKVALHIGLNLFSAALYLVLVWWFTQYSGFGGIVEAHLWRYLAFWLFLVVFYRKLLF